jgi:hypothetical protein
MKTTEAPPPFVLPRLSQRLAADAFGFYREAGARLGFYEPGKRPQIYDPIWTESRSPEAILSHEDTHQQLIINTHHGILTQLLARRSSDGQVQQSLRSCLEEQWSVQELAATYAELSLVQQTLPQQFESTVSELPTMVLDQPPYRELFQAAHKLLPIEKGGTPEDNISRANVILVIAACSLQTGCLVELASAEFVDAEFAMYLRRESPHLRFEQIARSLRPSGILELARDTARRLRSSPELEPRQAQKQALDSLINEIRRVMPEVPIQSPNSLESQSAAAIERLASRAKRTILLPESEGLSPEFVDSPEKRRKIEEFLRVDNGFDRKQLSEWLKECAATGGDLHLILGLPESQGAPFSAVCITTSPLISSPDDLRSMIEPAELLELLRPFERFPKVVTFVGDAWLAWYDLFRLLPRDSWVHQRLNDAIRICVHRRFSIDLLRELLQFEDLGRDASAFVFSLSRSLYVGCFASEDVPRVYALQKIPSDAALRLFNEFLDELDIGVFKNPLLEVPQFELLKRIVVREFTDPADFH